MDKPSSPRLPYADSARAFAILLVVILHVAASLVDKVYAAGKLYWWFANFIDSAARISVPLFVLVSGTLLLDPRRSESLAVFFRKRVIKVLLPLLGWSVIYLVWRIRYEGESFTLLQAVLSILENNVANHFWFLYMILGLYLAAPVLRVFTRTATDLEYKYFLVIWIVAVCLSPFLAHFFGISLSQYWVVVTGFSGYFIAGYFFSQTSYSARLVRWAVALYMIALLVTIAGTYLLLRKSGQYDSYFYEFLSPNVIIMSLAAYLILRWLPYERIYTLLPWLHRSISVVCATSFGVYMVHVMLLSILKSGRLGFVLSGASLAPGVGIVLTFLIAMPASIGIVFLLQRIPILKFLAP
jgi:surface polysaccharide O-acyltransferase-like enzyme